MRRILKWNVSVDDRKHSIGSGEVLHVACQHDSLYTIQVWTLEPFAGTVSVERNVQVFGTGQPFSETYKHLGTALSLHGGFVWHVLELPTLENEVQHPFIFST